MLPAAPIQIPQNKALGKAKETELGEDLKDPWRSRTGRGCEVSSQEHSHGAGAPSPVLTIPQEARGQSPSGDFLGGQTSKSPRTVPAAEAMPFPPATGC